MDNTDQSIAVESVKADPAARGEKDGVTSPETLKAVMDQKAAGDGPQVNGVSEDSLDSQLDKQSDKSKDDEQSANTCNGIEPLKPSETVGDNSNAHSKKPVEPTEECLPSPDQVVGKEEDNADISDDDIEEEDNANISDDDIISSGTETKLLESSGTLENQDDSENTVKSSDGDNQTEGNDEILKADDNNLEQTAENSSLEIISKPDCDKSKDEEPKEKYNPNVAELDDSDVLGDTTSDSMELIGEAELSAEDIHAGSQSIMSESEGPALLLELSHESEGSEPKTVHKKTEGTTCLEQHKSKTEEMNGESSGSTISDNKELKESVEKDAETNAVEAEQNISDSGTEALSEKLNSNDSGNKFAKNVLEPVKTQVIDKKEESVCTDSLGKTTDDTCDEMEVSYSSDIKSENDELSKVDNKSVTKDDSMTEASTTETLDTTADTSYSIDSELESTKCKTELNGAVKSETKCSTEKAGPNIIPISNNKLDTKRSDHSYQKTAGQKSKKLDQLLSKITTKAESENAKGNENLVPKKAKARKSFASSVNSSKPSSSSSSTSISLPTSSSSYAGLTFNVKELEKRGVLDMPKPQKRKAFDPVKKRPVEQRDQSTNVIDLPPCAKISKTKSSLKSPTKHDIPFFTKGKVIKGKKRKGKKSGRYRLPGEKYNKKGNVKKRDSEERQLSAIVKVTSAMSVTDKVKKIQALENQSEVVGAVEEKTEDSARNAFNESLGLSRKGQFPAPKKYDTGINDYKQNALDIMTKNSKLSFSSTPSSNVKKAKKSVRHANTHRTLDSFLKGATYSQMNSSLKLGSEKLSGKKHKESQNSGSGDVRKRKATGSPSNSSFRAASGSPGVGQEEKKRKVDGVLKSPPTPIQTQVITLVPTGSPPVPMHSVMSSTGGGTGHSIILSPPGSNSGTQTLIQNGTINGLPMFQIVNNSSVASSQPPQLLAISPGQGNTPRSSALIQPKGMPVLLAPVQMPTVACSMQTKTTVLSSLPGNTVCGNQVTLAAGNMGPQSSQSLFKSLMSPGTKTYLPNGQMLNAKPRAKNGSFVANGLYPVTPPKIPEEPLSETTSQDSVEVSPGGSVPPDKDVIPLCTCKISGASFQKVASAVTYCQSLDSVDGKVMGCCNKVTNMQLVRPAVKIPFLAVCEAHRKRLRAHQCCPGCGHYCTQGRFLQCKKEGGNSVHLFHEQCQVTKDGRNFCPHCGETSAQFEVHLTMQEHKPSVIKDNKPARSQKQARITMNEKKGSGEESGDEGSGGDKGKKPPSAKEITIGPDRYSLERFLQSLEGERPKKYRHLPKCLYTPAYDNDLERVVYMLEDKFNPNEKYEDLEGQGAIHAAAIIGNLPIVHVLVQAGASVHLTDKTLRTALMYAAEYNHSEVVSYLLRAGAVCNAKADDGMSALHYAAKSGNVKIIRQLLDTEEVQVNITDDGGWTPLIWAVEHKELEAVKFLLKRNTDPNLRDSEENTTIHWAAFAGNVAVAELLLSAGCDLDSLNMHGDRPLHIAARQDHYECVVLFLARGADVEAKNNKGETPLECCLEQSSAVYLALRVNKQLKGFGAKHMGRPEKLLHRDLSKGRENIPIPCVNQVDDDGVPHDYLYVTDNIETTNLKINRVIGSLQSCQCKDDCSSIYCACGKNSIRCWYDKYSRLVEEFNMVEPPLIFECNRACECWTTCNNRVVQNGVMSRLQVFKTEGRGWGCRTLVDIPRGTFICEYIGEHISDSEADSREDDSYLFDLDNRDGETYCIDARRYGNIARFINHLCEPNLVPVKVFVDSQDLRFPRICLFASRDIKAMEELGFDYGEKFWIIKWKQFTCTCGTVKCRYSKDTIQKTLEEYRQRHEEEAEVNPE